MINEITRKVVYNYLCIRNMTLVVTKLIYSNKISLTQLTETLNQDL